MQFGMSRNAAEEHVFKASTLGEVEQVFANTKLQNPDMLVIIEVIIDAMYAPWRMLQTIALRGPEMAKEMEEGGFKLITPTTK